MEMKDPMAYAGFVLRLRSKLDLDNTSERIMPSLSHQTDGSNRPRYTLTKIINNGSTVRNVC